MTRSATTCALLLFLGLGLFGAAPARAIEGGDLALGTVLGSVDAYHPLIDAERASLDAARGEALAARGGFDLTLRMQARSAVAGYYDPTRLELTLEQPTAVLGASVYAGYRTTYGKVAPYYGEQRTLDGGEVRGGVRVPLLADRATDARRTGLATTAAREQAAEQGVRELQLLMQRDAVAAYYAWVVAGQRVRVLRDLVQLAERRNAQVAQQVEHGVLAPIEQLDNQRAIFERTRQLVSAQRVFEKAAIDLSLYVRDTSGMPRVPLDTELPASIAMPERLAITAQAAEARALAQRPELQRADAQIAEAEAERALADNQLDPRLEVFSEVSRDVGDGALVDRQQLAPTVVEVGASFSMPLQQRSANGKLDAALAKQSAARRKRDFAGDKVRAEVRDALSQLTAAEARLDVAQKGAEVAQNVAIGERERFEHGASTVLFVNLREQAAADAELAVLEAMLELAVARARVQLVMGERVQAH